MELIRLRVLGVFLSVSLLGGVGPAAAQETVPAVDAAAPAVSEAGDSVAVRLVHADLRVAIQALSRYLDKPLVFGNVPEVRVTLETPHPVPAATIPELLRGLLETYNLDLDEEEDFYRVGQGQPQRTETPQQEPSSLVQLFVIELRHARAEDVAGTVSALYGQASALGEYGASPETLSQSLQQNLVPLAGQPEPGQPQPVIDRVAELSGNVRIIPDPRTNSLLVRASQTDFELIEAAVQELDVRPLQVLIEVVIAEVRRDRSLGIGLGADLPPQPVPGTTDTEVSGSTTGLSLGDLVLDAINVGGVDMSLALRAAASRGEVSILSRPVVIAANNETSEILVGSQRPFVQVQRALPTDAPVRDQVVQFKDVGTRLAVTPTISSDGYVMLDVAQEVNAATAEVAFDAPVISTRSIQTQLLVRDGHTAVLGGLTDRQQDESRSGVPILSEIPLIGWLFGSHVTRSTETELFVFLTPRVIRTDQDMDEAVGTQPKRTRGLVEGVILLPPKAPSPDSVRASGQIGSGIS